LFSRIIALYRKVPIWFSRGILLPFFVTRIALILIAWLAFHFIPLPSTFPLSWEIGRDGFVERTSRGAPQNHAFINMWSRWDAGWYLEIAKQGHHYYSDQPSSAAFFPLYPIAIRLFHGLLNLPSTDISYLVVASLFSNFCLIAGLAYLHTLASLTYNDRVANYSVICLLLFPTSFFLSSSYSESLFFVLGVSSLYYARKKYWLAGCVLAALATLARSQGVILIVPLLVEYLSQRQWKPRRIRWNLAGLLFVPAALLIFVAYLKWKFGSWSILFDAQRPWGRQLLAPWYGLRWVVTHAAVVPGMKNDWIDLAFFALLVIVALFFSRRLGLSDSFYIWSAVIFFSSWGMLGSTPRLLLGVFPVFICLAMWCEQSRPFRLAFLTLSAITSAFFFVMYSQWQWVA
jgi:hypothetical protein